MNNFGKSSVHNFSLVEFFVFLFVIGLVSFIVWPRISKFLQKVQIDSAIDGVYSYKDSVSKYYVSRLMYDSSFRLDGRYTITGNNLSRGNDVYNLRLTGNVPNEGYLDYDNNVLKDGCILIDGYYVVVSNGSISISDGSCMIQEDVDVVLNEF